MSEACVYVGCTDRATKVLRLPLQPVKGVPRIRARWELCDTHLEVLVDEIRFAGGGAHLEVCDIQPT